jgi:methyl-accepting chemotaxis protein
VTKTFADNLTTDLAAFDPAMTAYRAGHPAGDPATIDDLATTWQQYTGIAKNQLQISRSVDTVSAGSEEMGASIR